MFSVDLTNYRSFQNETFHFSKVNILIGENSSGKSSLFKLLLALKQTLQPPSNREINLSFTGEYADLGSYKEAVYYHQEDLPLKMVFTFNKNYYSFFIRIMKSLEDDENIKADLGGKISGNVHLSITVTKELNDHKSIQTIITNEDIGKLSISYDENNIKRNDKLLTGTTCNIEYYDKLKNVSYEFKTISYTKDGFLSLIDGSSLHGAIEKYLKNLGVIQEDNEISRLYNRIAFLLISQNFLKYYLDKIDYINPINTHPSRLYLYKDPKQNNSIKDIEDVVDFFSKADISESITAEFSTILGNFGIAENIEIIKANNMPVRELRVRVKDLLSNIKDVGYGVSLQLPILLKALLSERISTRRDSIILIEQPEVHLHPKLHAQFIDTLMSLAKNTTYFIETHSEHIVRKLQVLVKEKKYNLKPEDITIHYLRRIDKKSEVTSHRIDENGYLMPPFPSGFFDNSYILAKELLD